MPKVPLLSSCDPVLEAMEEVLMVLQARLQSGEDLEGLESWLGEFFESVSQVEVEGGLRFEL